MKKEIDYALHPIGFVESSIVNREDAPSQGNEGAPDAWITFNKNVAEGLDGIHLGEEIIVLTWFHQSKRDVLKLHPRWDKRNPLTGVFATRSPDRPNPIGLHQVKVLQIENNRIKVASLEAIDGTPVIDVKPVLN
ncbi:MAG TPA: tRNA (N6-threonylcarbamoyladenosine(37)-N6)-methyltransferase TrmO [Cyclobacteriaceae bacterium]|jgi:tRNA-Thr(GGU) m(6)t(6)A37 methyltransferase TsaA|nr:tRNA (N6-threonylcarbamoyladenosine(37)-N6)-methyltransferase TrmO [Cyclobacteriaceae bacterium]